MPPNVITITTMATSTTISTSTATTSATAPPRTLFEQDNDDSNSKQEETTFCEDPEFCVEQPLSADCKIICPMAMKQTIESLCKDSKIFTTHDCSLLLSSNNDTLTNEKELNIAPQELGSGGFCTVYPCTKKKASKHVEYALKQLKPTLIKADPAVLQKCTADLVKEALFLQQLHHHENIVCLYNVTFKTKQDIATFGLLLQKVDTTLDKQFKQWKIQFKGSSSPSSPSSSLFKRFNKQYKNKKQILFQEKLEIVLQIANVMEYLHSMKLVFRDLKPDNIGLHYNNNDKQQQKPTVKLFDFGLCREIKASEANQYEMYYMTGNTGAKRYMAPEVALGKPYNQKVDVYSFGIVLWEILTLELPFKKYNDSKLMSKVILGSERPALSDSWPPELQTLMQKCWTTHPDVRPTFTQITNNNELQTLLLSKS